MEAGTGDVTSLPRQWSDGGAQALEQLAPVVYKELPFMAYYHFHGERAGHALQTTSLVHAVYLSPAALT